MLENTEYSIVLNCIGHFSCVDVQMERILSTDTYAVLTGKSSNLEDHITMMFHTLCDNYNT